MITFEQTLHRHPLPAHVSIHLVQPRPSGTFEECSAIIVNARAPSLNFRSRLLGIASAVAAGSSVIGMIYLFQAY